MKNEMLNVYYDVSYYLEKAEENLRNAEDILHEDMVINDCGYKTSDISDFRQSLVDFKYDVDYTIIQAIKEMEE